MPPALQLFLSLFAKNIIAPLLGLVLLHEQPLSSLVAYLFLNLFDRTVERQERGVRGDDMQQMGPGRIRTRAAAVRTCLG